MKRKGKYRVTKPAVCSNGYRLLCNEDDSLFVSLFVTNNGEFAIYLHEFLEEIDGIRYQVINGYYEMERIN